MVRIGFGEGMWGRKTRVGWTRAALLLTVALSILGGSGCGGGSDFKNKPRPPVPLHLSGVITDKAVSVEPAKFGAGPIDLLISNQTQQSHTVTLQGGPNNISEEVGPINPLDTGHIQQNLKPGNYTVVAGSESAVVRQVTSAKLHVGPPRQSSSGTVLLP